jgi:hypothetical protein
LAIVTTNIAFSKKIVMVVLEAIFGTVYLLSLLRNIEDLRGLRTGGWSLPGVMSD